MRLNLIIIKSQWLQSALNTQNPPLQRQHTILMATLDSLKEGQRARVVDIDGEDAISVRLMEMGLTEGEEIQLIGIAPLGDPMEFSLRGYRLSLRAREARRVEIELSED
jgi:ferrous iron transport protein A